MWKYNKTLVLIGVATTVMMLTFLFGQQKDQVQVNTESVEFDDSNKRKIAPKEYGHSMHLIKNIVKDESGYLKYVSYLRMIDYSCSRVVRVGNTGDGGWNLCMDSHFRLNSNDCLIYSFGIRDDWTFDDHISMAYGCEVHSFDPSINKPDHKRSKLVHFHNLGILGRETKKPWRKATFTDIVKILHHEKRIIDVVKVDVEGDEFTAVKNMKTEHLKSIKQFILEVHLYKASFKEMIYMFNTLELNGFRKFFFLDYTFRSTLCKETVNILRTPLCQFELLFVNTNYVD